MAILTSDRVLGLGVSQDAYDSISMNRKSTFVNIFTKDEEFLVSVNTLDMKQGSDFLFLAEVLRAAELANLVELNSLCEFKGIYFRLAAVQTSELQSNLKRNIAKREDFKKAPAAPAQPVVQTAIQQPTF